MYIWLTTLPLLLSPCIANSARCRPGARLCWASRSDSTYRALQFDSMSASPAEPLTQRVGQEDGMRCLRPGCFRHARPRLRTGPIRSQVAKPQRCLSGRPVLSTKRHCVGSKSFRACLTTSALKDCCSARSFSAYHDHDAEHTHNDVSTWGHNDEGAPITDSRIHQVLAWVLSRLGLLQLASLLREKTWNAVLISTLMTVALVSTGLAGYTTLPQHALHQLSTAATAVIYIFGGIPELVDLSFDITAGHIDTHVLMTLAVFGTLAIGGALEVGYSESKSPLTHSHHACLLLKCRYFACMHDACALRACREPC